jgi:hypothetical protein
MLLLSWFLLALCRRWGKPVIVYGPPSLAKDHPVIKFLADQQRCASLSFYKQGCVEQRVQASAAAQQHSQQQQQDHQQHHVAGFTGMAPEAGASLRMV